MAGYSATPLAKKLGIKDGMVLSVPGARPFADLLHPLPDGSRGSAAAGAGRPGGGVLDGRGRRDQAVARASPAPCGPHGVVWVAWPKKSSGFPTDLTEDTFRGLLLPTGWVDVKVCAIDDTWSGLKFVLRKELRPSN